MRAAQSDVPPIRLSRTLSGRAAQDASINSTRSQITNVRLGEAKRLLEKDPQLFGDDPELSRPDVLS